jgi:hypothetical protein
LKELRPAKVKVIANEIYRYVGQHHMSIDEMLMGVSLAYDKLIKENYIEIDEVPIEVLRGQCENR